MQMQAQLQPHTENLTMKIQFPLTLAAVQKGEKSQWAIGDAQGIEIKLGKAGIDVKSGRRFAACAKELAEQGFDISANRLRQLRDLAHHFPSASREAKVPLNAHQAAGSPQNLKLVIEALNKIGKPITTDNVRLIMK